MNANHKHRVLGIPIASPFLALIVLSMVLTVLPHKAVALTPSSLEVPLFARSPIVENEVQGAERRLLYDDVVDTYQLFTGIAGGTFLQDYYFGETTKGLAYRQYYIRKAPTLLGTRTYDFGQAYIPGYGSASGYAEVWQYSYEVH